MKILIFGAGWIGTRCKEVWGDEAVLSDKFVNTKQDALDEIIKYNPDVVLNAAGIVGKPNVDWCDSHQMETILGNTILPITIAQATQETSKYLLHMGTGCIFYGDSPHDDKTWREDDIGNPKPVYTRSKMAADLVLSTLPNVGVARIRMPIDYKPFKGNLIDKVTTYEKVIDVENSVTILEDMIDAFYQLMEKRGEGIFHVVNPGAMRHRDLIGLYEELVDPSHTCEWIEEEELLGQGLVTKKRSNNILNSDRLNALGIHLRPIDIALRDTMEKYAKEKNG